MPKRVPFRVIYSSGGDEGYSAKELEVQKLLVLLWSLFTRRYSLQVQSPYSKGWRSPRQVGTCM